MRGSPSSTSGELNWHYVYALLASQYGFNVDKLTLTQMRVYLSMIPYVNPWSEKFGEMPGTPRQKMQEKEDIEAEMLFHEGMLNG